MAIVTTTTDIALRIMLMLVANLQVVSIVPVASWASARFGSRANRVAAQRNMNQRVRWEVRMLLWAREVVAITGFLVGSWSGMQPSRDGLPGTGHASRPGWLGAGGTGKLALRRLH